MTNLAAIELAPACGTTSIDAVRRFLGGEHRKLEAHFGRALEALADGDPSAWGRFREELLRHIGIEERILLPALREARGGDPDPLAARLRLDHGALAALLVPSPTSRVLGTIAGILAEHEPREEGPGGLFASADESLASRAPSIVERMQLAPSVPVSPHNDDPRVLPAVERALSRAGYRLLARSEASAAIERLCEIVSLASGGELPGVVPS